MGDSPVLDIWSIRTVGTDGSRSRSGSSFTPEQKKQSRKCLTEIIAGSWYGIGWLDAALG